MTQELKVRRSVQILDGGFTQKRHFFRICLGMVSRSCSVVFTSVKETVTAKRFLALSCAGLSGTCGSLGTDGPTDKPCSPDKWPSPNCDHYATSDDSGSYASTR